MSFLSGAARASLYSCAVTLALVLASLSAPVRAEAPPVSAEVAEADADPIDHGGVHLDLWFSDTADINAALQLGGDGAYVLLTGGVVLTHDADPSWQVGGGFGTRAGIDRFFIELDLTGSAVLDHDGAVQPLVLARGRLGVGWRFASHFALFGGAALNLLVELEAPELESSVPDRAQDQGLDASSSPGSSRQAPRTGGGGESDTEQAPTPTPTPAVAFEPLAASDPGSPVPWTLWPGFYVGFEF